MCSSGCLITDPPQFTAPQHTAPFLLEVTASPDPKQIFKVDDANLPAEITFSAQVVSQDDSSPTSSFYDVKTKLYIDYGYPDNPGGPFFYDLDGTAIAPGTLQTTKRLAAAQWSPIFNQVPYGCHTATLVASHVFDDQRLAGTQCPLCADDYTMITWQVLRCNSSMTGTSFDCTKLPITGPTSCAGLTSSCAQVLAEPDAGAPACPEPATDGGAGGGGS